jgi:Tuberculosis necrotizing toxin
MGIELPEVLAGVAAATGLSWPQADEDKLREQASAWRDAQGKLTSLAAESDHTAHAAVGALTGPSAEAAATLWSGFVHPDHGHLTTAARGAGAAADRLDYAADQIGAAKVEMVRQLVDASKNSDAAHTAAAAGHPTALLSLDTTLHGTATNLSSLTQGLAGAVGPGGGGPVTALSDVVDPNPGTQSAHGQSGLVGVALGLPAPLLSTVDSAPPFVPQAAAPVPAADLPAGPPPLEPPTPAAAQPAVMPPPLAGAPVPVPGPVPDADAGTGPIQLPAAPGHYGGFLQSGGFDDVPTPAAGTPAPQVPGVTVASGFTDAAYSAPPPPPPAPAAPIPVAPPPVAPLPVVVPQPGYPAPAPFAGAPPVGGAMVPPPAPGAAPAAGFSPRRSPSGYPPPTFHAAPRAQAPPPSPPPAPPLPPLAAPRRERESIVALFLVHMFPLGHLPVAADRPARQLPVPPAELDYAPGLRFPPHDHPRSELIDSSDALEKVRAGLARLPTPAVEPPAVVTEDHQPLGGLPERDWHRRFLAGMRGEVPEYAWPPGELYPEGGYEAGEPELLPEGTLLDRFGRIGGRVFAADGTAFAQRSLPPSALGAGYRRYEVLREVPMWRAVSAPWFGQPGGGIRYRSVYSADELITMGYLADVTFEEGR